MRYVCHKCGADLTRDDVGVVVVEGYYYHSYCAPDPDDG